MNSSDQPVVVVGIDCATDPAKVGLARAEFFEDALRLTHAELGSRRDSIPNTIKAWLSRTRRGLLAFDSPLGWPSLLSESLPHHEAGQRLAGDANRLFHRLTDDFVYAKIGKKSLEVGADRIARTAHSTLAMLDRIRSATRQEIPLAWEPDLPPGVFAIEVYPAATLRAHEFVSSAYKRPHQTSRRDELLAQISPLLFDGLDVHRSTLLASADALDAVVCTIAAADFLRGDAMPPNIHPEIARKEGWIWVRPKRAA